MAASFVVVSVNFPSSLAYVFRPSFRIKITIGIVKRPLRRITFPFSIVDILACALISVLCLLFVLLKRDYILVKRIGLQSLGSSKKQT